jgi:hypothetical protein
MRTEASPAAASRPGPFDPVAAVPSLFWWTLRHVTAAPPPVIVRNVPLAGRSDGWRPFFAYAHDRGRLSLDQTKLRSYLGFLAVRPTEEVMIVVLEVLVTVRLVLRAHGRHLQPVSASRWNDVLEATRVEPLQSLGLLRHLLECWMPPHPANEADAIVIGMAALGAFVRRPDGLHIDWRRLEDVLVASREEYEWNRELWVPGVIRPM